MKKQIITFIVGLLLGAIISTASIYIYTLANKETNNMGEIQMPNNNDAGGQMGQNNNGNPPEMPNNNNTNTESNN